MTYDEESLVRDLKALMKMRKRSARSISEAIKVPYRSIQNYLSGESRIPAVVLIAILDELGADIRLLRHGDALLSHWDLNDAIFRVFGDYLSEIDIDAIGQTRNLGRSETTPEDLMEQTRRVKKASTLAGRLSEAYDEMVRGNRMVAGGQSPTIKELKERHEQRLAAQEQKEKD
ncbi:hypothetical protein ACJ4V0_15145 [Phreatobacter sp. HK31-P]